ncbi:hypothetical protein VaNZ11_012785 [Volvox africanus]|uniref:peptide-methionine (S)-S-oxide reductase n=1 Tax=Volvox africanus TaxID=51714 RepID=A0ABQ5SF44_9CHLO|nr:hypothetical protein VaNZ11_012785 [Volvox africanus]
MGEDEPCRLAPEEAPPGLKLATFSGACFWCLELGYQRVPGVITTSAGYTGGSDPAPNYLSVADGHTGHAEAVQCIYDPNECTYDQLLDTLFEVVDPTVCNFHDGKQYRTGIYFHDEEQQQAAAARIVALNDQLKAGTAPSHW